MCVREQQEAILAVTIVHKRTSENILHCVFRNFCRLRTASIALRNDFSTLQRAVLFLANLSLDVSIVKGITIVAEYKMHTASSCTIRVTYQ